MFATLLSSAPALHEDERSARVQLLENERKLPRWIPNQLIIWRKRSSECRDRSDSKRDKSRAFPCVMNSAYLGSTQCVDPAERLRLYAYN